MLLKTFGWSLGLTVLALAVATLYAGGTGITVTAILIVLEISLSFDNAVVNAKILGRMSAYWQKIFLTVGVLIAVLGMRLVFPLVVVGVTAHLSPARAYHLALAKGDPDTKGTYGYILHSAHPSIAAFGGIFLLMIFLDWLLDDEKELHWLGPLERTFQKAGSLDKASVLLALVVLLGFGLGFSDHTKQVLTAGIAGMVAYLAVNGLGQIFEVESDEELDDLNGTAPGAAAVILATGKAAFSLFIYLELLDASFSFDGVIGAFAITSDPIIIALGLGVGSLYVRSLTVYLVRKGTLSEYVFLEHGAHWAIGALAILLMVTIGQEIPEVVTGLIGVAFIAAAFFWSLRYNRLEDEKVAA